MIGQSVLSWFCPTRLMFILFIACHYVFSKNFGNLILESSGHKNSAANLRKLGFKYKKDYWDSKMHPSCLTPLVLSIFNLPCQLWGVITFEQVLSLCWNFQDNLISYIPFIQKSFSKLSDGSCPALVHLTWNDPALVVCIFHTRCW